MRKHDLTNKKNPYGQPDRKKTVFFFLTTSLSDCDEERKHLLAGAQVTQFAGSKQESNFTDN